MNNHPRSTRLLTATVAFSLVLTITPSARSSELWWSAIAHSGCKRILISIIRDDQGARWHACDLATEKLLEITNLRVQPQGSFFDADIQGDQYRFKIMQCAFAFTPSCFNPPYRQWFNDLFLQQ